MNRRPRFSAALLMAALLGGLVFTAVNPWEPVQGTDTFDGAWGTPVDPDTGLPTGPLGRHFRVLVAVDALDMDGVRDLPVQAVLDLAEILAEQADYPAQEESGGIRLSGFELAIDSFIVQEVDEEGVPLNGDYLPVIVEPGDVHGDGSFDPVREPVVTARWVMPGPTEDTRYFHVYFDSTHNNPGPGPAFSTEEQMPLATSIGPGRGTTLFLPLHSLSGPQAANEPRYAHVTALHDDTTVRFHEYGSGGTPRSDPVREASLARGEAVTYGFGQDGGSSSHGTVMVVADRPVLAEALAVRQDHMGSFVPNNFIPSADGGFLGSAFIANPRAPETWHVFCPSVANGGDCTVNGRTVPLDNTRLFNMAAGSTAELVAEDGARVLVQRAGDGLTYWPPADGPGLATHFMGHAGSSDAYLATAGAPQTQVLVRSLSTPAWLASSTFPWKFPQRGLEQERMDRPWEAAGEHETGGLRIQTLHGTDFGFISGRNADDSSLVAPQSSDGGRTYRVIIPQDGDGNPMGRIVIFALFDGTSVSAERLGGGTETLPTLRAGERTDLDADGGVWTIRGDRPIVVAWLSVRSPPTLGAYAPGFTDAAEVTVIGADYSGYALEMNLLGPSSLQRERGDQVRFSVEVTNRAQDVAGNALGDTAHAELRVPSADWQPQVDIPSRVLGPGETGTFGMRARVPDGVTPGSGATLRPTVTSESNENLVVERSLQVNFIISHAVEVREAADVRDQSIELEETATYEIIVINRGSAVDAFNMEFACPPDNWNQAIVPLFESTGGSADSGETAQNLSCDSPTEDLRTPKLGSGEQTIYFVHMSPGEEVSMASRATTRITATSVGDRSVTDSIRLSTIVGAERSFRVVVDEPTRTIVPGGETTFNLTVHNDAEVNEELRVDLHSSVPPGWAEPEVRWVEEVTSLAAVNNTIPIPAQSNVTLTLTRQVPGDSPALTLALDRLRMRSQFDRETPASDTPLRIIVATLRGVEATVGGPGHAVDPGVETRFTLALESLGNVNQTLQVRPVMPGGDWTARNGDDASPPWRVKLSAFEQMEIPILVRPDPTTSPGPESGRIDFEITGFGFDAKTVGRFFGVEERRAVDVEEREVVHLDAGRLNEIDIGVKNAGNIELVLKPGWEDLPDWDVSTESLRLSAGQRGTLSTWLWVPPEALGVDDFTANLNVVHTSGVLSTNEWAFVVKAPRLEATIEDIQTINDDQARYTVRVTNIGNDSARNVTVLLDHAQEGTLDNFQILQILPAGSALANLVGPVDPSEVQVRVIADHDPEGFLATPSEVDLDEETAPALAPIFLVALVAALALLAAALRRPR